MNINSNELLLINKRNMKFGISAQDGTTNPIPEATETQPNATMNALDLQGKNNIAFQGVQTEFAKKASKKAIVALMALAAIATQSCSIENHAEAVVDTTALVELLAEMKSLFQEMLNLQKINNEQNETMIKYIQGLIQDVADMKISQKEFYERATEYMMNDETTQKTIIEILKNQGKTQEEIQAKLDNIYDLMQQGKYEEALNKIMEILGDIDATLKGMMDAVNEIKQIYNDLLEQGRINNQENESMNAYLAILVENVKEGLISQEAFQELVVKHLMKDEAIQAAIQEALEAQGLTQQDIRQSVKDIFALIESKDYQAALDKITEILSNMNQQLDAILEQLKLLRDDIKSNHEDYIYNQHKQIDYLSRIYDNGLRKEDIDALCKAWAEANANLKKLADNSDKMFDISESQFKALMDKIGSLELTDEDYAKFEEMFKIMNMNIQDLFNKYMENEAEARKEYLEAGKDFQANVIGNLTKVNEQLFEINNNILESSDYPGLDKYHAAIEDAIKNLTDALEAGKTDVTGLLKEVITNQNALFEVVKAMYEEVGDVSSKMSTLIDIEKANAQTTQKQLDEVIGGLKDLKGSSNITNTLLASINEDTAGLLLYADKALNSANQVVAQGVNIENAIKALAESMGKDPSEITYKDLEKLLKEQNQDAFKMFTQFMQDTGLANVSGDLGTVKDLLIAIEKNTSGIKSLDDTVKKVAQIVSNIDWTSTENLAQVGKLIELLKNLKVYCECNCNGGTGTGDNEGTWPGLGDLEDIFG